MKGKAAWAWLLAATLLIGTGILLTRQDSDRPDDWTRHAMVEIRPEQGLAFQATLPATAPSAHEAPVEAVLLEDGREIGKASDHEAIRQHGAGRCSFWHGTLWFSSSDGSDPRSNGRRYEVAWRPSSPVRWQTLSWTAAGACTLVALLTFLRGRVRRRTWQRLALAGATGALCLLAVEIVLRIRYPFGDSTWPGTFDAKVGLHFAPDRDVQRTNLFDFAQVQHTNSLGFLDREPRELQPGERRIVVLGDSFVEAVQVPIEQKFHVRLEEELRARGIAVATQAFGMSGAGTSTELGWYRELVRPLHPTLVIVLFVYNDFANNSPLLESIRNGWHHAHAPRPYLTDLGGNVHWQPIDPDWENHIVSRPGAAPQPPLASLLGWSRLFQWTVASTRWISGSDVARTNREQFERLQLLRADPVLGPMFADWHHPDDLDIDGMVAAKAPPPAFQDTIRWTLLAMRELAEEIESDGGRLLVVLADNLAEPPQPNPRGRELFPGAWLRLATQVCDVCKLPRVDLHADFTERGVSGRTHFVRDRHWNALGHATAASVVAERIARQPELLGE